MGKIIACVIFFTVNTYMSFPCKCFPCCKVDIPQIKFACMTERSCTLLFPKDYELMVQINLTRWRGPIDYIYAYHDHPDRVFVFLKKRRRRLLLELEFGQSKLASTRTVRTCSSEDEIKLKVMKMDANGFDFDRCKYEYTKFFLANTV